MSADTKLRALDERPGGKYAYCRGIRVKAVLTFAEAGTGGTFTPAQQISAMRSITFEHDEFARMTALSFLNIVRNTQQAQEVYGPDEVAAKLPVAGIAHSAGTTTATLDFIIPLAKALYKRGASNRAKYTGLVSAASLKKNGKLEVLGCSSATLQGTVSNGWNCSSIAVNVWLEMVLMDYPVETVFVKESLTESAVNAIMADWDGERRMLSALCTDDTDGDMTANNSDGIVTIDSQVVNTSLSSAELISEVDTNRLDGINDIYPAVHPLVVLTDKDLEDCPIVQSSYKAENMNSAHSGAYRLLTVQSKRVPLNVQAALFRLQKVPQPAIDAYVAAVNARSVTEAWEEIGLAVRVLQNEAARGVQEYL
jgi:hypothetical protein